MRGRRPRIAVLAALAALILTSAAASGGPGGFEATPLEPDSTFHAIKSDSGALAKSDPALLARRDATPVNVLIKYDYDATASYDGDVRGLAATSPEVTGKSLKQNRRAVRAYESYTAKRSQRISAAVRKAVPSATISRSFRTAYGGVAARVPANQVKALLRVPGVAAVQKDALLKPQTDATPGFIGATDVWATIGGSTRAGEGVIVGILDSGIWPEHPSFRVTSQPAPPGTYGCEFGSGSDPALGPAFACNNKLIGAYAFTDTYMAVLGALAGEYCNNTTGACSARDADGHGTHTASTAAGDPVASAPIFGIERGPISGIAPGAHVIAYRVCLNQGCFGSDSVAAVQQAILDDIDVINFSISGGANAYSDAVELAFLDAFHAGISVNASAGNDGPGSGTANHAGPWVTTVGASTSNRSHSTTLNLTASNGDTLAVSGVTITPGVGPAPVVLATSLPGGDALCVNPLAAGSATGMIVVCQRGPNRILKSNNVRNAGGVGMILYNATPLDLMTDNHWVPSVHVADASPANFVASHTGVTAQWATSTKTPRQGNVMTTFSSRGPVGDFIKPDITAPGIQIVAGNTPTPVTSAGGPPGQLFMAIAGTSMSGPHSAGASALVKAAHPDWSPAQIKSALMTSATQDAVKPDGTTPADPFDAGAGALKVSRAVNPTLVLDETYENYVASAATPLQRIDLNLPSINAPTMTGTITTKRTVENVTGVGQDMDVVTQAPTGAEIRVNTRPPDALHGDRALDSIWVQKHQTLDLWITISAPTLPTGQYFGRITFVPTKPGYNSVTFPVAFFKRQGNVTMSQTCSPLTFLQKTGSAHCTTSLQNFAAVAAATTVTAGNLDRGGNLQFGNVSAPGAPGSVTSTGDGFKWTGTLSASVPPQILSITPGGSPAGYLPLSLFGVAPIAGVGDETISNFNTPTFMYGGEPYSRIGLVSNGYVVIGGGTADDVEFEPQTFPNAARPNNVIAPFWTDLNPVFGGALRIATLTDGVSTWLVADWENVRNYSNANTHSMQVWLRLGNTVASEQVSMTFGANGPGDPSGTNWGAENRDGTSGVNLAAQPGTNADFRVNTTGPTPGGSATIEFDVTANRAGVYRSVTGMSSNVTPGITQIVQTFTVTKP